MSRLVALFALACLPFVGGCTSTEGIGRPPPRFKVRNVSRLCYEVRWLHADVQDVVFGVDYHLDMERQFGGGPYE
jgi:hypothetical protein